jgi:hypothetical protein
MSSLRFSALFFILFLGACHSPPESVELGAQAETAGAEPIRPSVESLEALRTALHAGDRFDPWYRCTATTGEDSAVIDFPSSSDHQLHARASYTMRDYNGSTVETHTDLGIATIAENIPGPDLHLVFALSINGRPARLDAGDVWSGKGTLTMDSLVVPMRCFMIDAPFDLRGTPE